MIFTTWTQWAVLALCLIAGWLFGRAGGGGRKWRERLREEEARHAAYRKDSDARIRELESERDRVARSAPVAAATATAAAAGSSSNRGFFGWGRDNLARIHGIDAALEGRINAEGIKTYHQIETMPVGDEPELEQRLGLSAGTIANQHWREQAAMLRDGRDEEHGRRWTTP